MPGATVGPEFPQRKATGEAGKRVSDSSNAPIDRYASAGMSPSPWADAPKVTRGSSAGSVLKDTN